MSRAISFLLVLIVSTSLFGAVYESPACPDLSKQWQQTLAPELHIPEADRVLDAECDSKQARLAYAAELLKRHLPELYNTLLKAKNMVLAGKSPDQSLADTDAETGLISLYDSLLEEGREYIAAQLVHEAAHLRSDDIDHVKCVAGDLKDAEASCAALFTGERTGDAYNFTYFTLNQFFLLGESDAEIDRPEVIRSVLDLLKNNFNALPAELIPKWEALAAEYP